MRQARRLLLFLAPLLLAACATTPAGGGDDTPSAAHAMLACTVATSIEGVDVIKQVLTCKVTAAPATETSMTLNYSVESGDGSQRQLSPACTGTLRNGTGSCTQTYATPAPMGSGPGSVSGETQPHHFRLGPVVPTQIPGTPGSPGPPA
jgi:predicted small secreted protein